MYGSTRSVTDNHGVQESYYDYDIFGSPITGNYTTGSDYGYLGKPYDKITGLYNYGYRDYSPQTVRFTTVDPIRDGSNWFAYVNNDPVNYVDLWGLLASDGKIDWIKEVSDVIGVKFGAQVSAGINVPDVFSFEVEVDLLSVNYEDGIGSLQSGVNMAVSIGNEYLPIGESSIGYEKEVEMSGSQTAFDLLNTDYEFVSETTVNQDFTVTIPTKFGLSVDINFTELSDLIIKSETQLINKIKDKS